MAFAGGVVAGLAIGRRMAPISDGRLTKAGRTVDEFIDMVSVLAYKSKRAIQGANCALIKVRHKVSDVVDARATEAHGAIDRTVAAVKSGAKTGHHVIDTTAETIRTGLRHKALRA